MKKRERRSKRRKKKHSTLAVHYVCCSFAGALVSPSHSHYGRFPEVLSQNWGMNFDSSSYIFIQLLKILGSKVHINVDRLPSFGMFEIEAKLQL